MSMISLRLPESLHASARALAEKENISLDQLITVALAEKLSALLTEDYLRERARRGNKKKFDRALDKIADGLPEERDQLPGREE